MDASLVLGRFLKFLRTADCNMGVSATVLFDIDEDASGTGTSHWPVSAPTSSPPAGQLAHHRDGWVP